MKKKKLINPIHMLSMRSGLSVLPLMFKLGSLRLFEGGTYSFYSFYIRNRRKRRREESLTRTTATRSWRISYCCTSPVESDCNSDWRTVLTRHIVIINVYLT